MCGHLCLCIQVVISHSYSNWILTIWGSWEPNKNMPQVSHGDVPHDVMMCICVFTNVHVYAYIYIYTYGPALASHPPHQWVGVDSIVWFFWSRPPCGLWWWYGSSGPPPCGLWWWYVGMLVCWYVGMMVCRYAGMLVCMYVCM